MRHARTARRATSFGDGLGLRSPLLLLLLFSGTGAGGCADADERPHLFLVTSDTLRADHLGSHGYHRNTSPNLDRFAARSLHFTQAITVLPKTGPAFTTHHSGLHPLEHGVTANKLVIPADVPMFAERLEAAGYRTAAFVSNPILEERKGYARGFGEDYHLFAKTGQMRDLQQAFEAWADEANWSRPTFVWVHYIDPHGPYTPPPRFADKFIGDDVFEADRRRIELEYEPLGKGWPKSYVLGALPKYQRQKDEDRFAWYISQYDAELRFMDSLFGQLVAKIEELGLYEKSAILFTSDHGESLDEHDYFFEHGWFVYEPTVHIPLMLKPPGEFAPARIDHQVTNLDTAPTLLTLAGLAPGPELLGTNLAGPLEDRGPMCVLNCSNYPQSFEGLRTPELKYVRDAESGVEQLFDLTSDPGETENLAGTAAARLVDLRAEHERCRARFQGRARAAVEVEYDAAHLKQIEDLGYAGETGAADDH